MPFITKTDLQTHIYPEGMTAISREDDAHIDEAITSAIQQASQYLTRYDRDVIFASEGVDRDKYTNLITYVKDIAKWHFIAVSNVTVDLDLAERRYEAALKELKQISNTLQPGWPLLDAEEGDKPFRSGSGLKFDHQGF